MTQLDVSEGNAMVWHVQIGKNFDTCRVNRNCCPHARASRLYGCGRRRHFFLADYCWQSGSGRRWTLRRALSPDFSAGALAVFIPWRVGAEESGAAKLLDLRGPPGRCSGCWPHDGEVAGGADFRFGAAAAPLSGTGSASPRPDRNSWLVRGQLRHDPIATAG